VARAIVLGGGGILGLAWETGLVVGLEEDGVNLRGAADVIGTSAGSMVATWITTGSDLAAAAEAQARALPEVESSSQAGIDVPRLTEAFGLWSSIETYVPDDGRRIGKVADAAKSTPEQAWVASVAEQIDTASWPSALRVSAVDVVTGEVALFERESRVPLERAVAASCAVPAVFPTVEIGGSRYMDGSIPTSTHAHRCLDRDTDEILVIATFDERTQGIGGLMNREREAEVARLRAAGRTVQVIRPSDEASRAMGPNVMDASRRGPATEAGHAQGRAEAARLSWRRS